MIVQTLTDPYASHPRAAGDQVELDHDHGHPWAPLLWVLERRRGRVLFVLSDRSGRTVRAYIEGGGRLTGPFVFAVTGVRLIVSVGTAQ